VQAKKLNDQEIAAVSAYYQQVASPVKVAEAQLKGDDLMPIDEPQSERPHLPEQVAARSVPMKLARR